MLTPNKSEGSRFDPSKKYVPKSEAMIKITIARNKDEIEIAIVEAEISILLVDTHIELWGIFSFQASVSQMAHIMLYKLTLKFKTFGNGPWHIPMERYEENKSFTHTYIRS